MPPRRKIFFSFLVFFSSLSLIVPAAPVFAQISTEDSEEAEELSVSAMEDFPIVKLRSLDKVTARTMTFETAVGSTLKFGSIYIKVQACRKPPPVEKPEAAAFLQVWEVTPQDEAQWIFSGWMFASSPGLSSMDHPIYDVWVLDCLEKKGTKDEQAKKEEAVRGEGEIPEEQIPEKPEAAMEEKPVPERDIVREILEQPVQ